MRGKSLAARDNPVPPSRRVQARNSQSVRQAAELFADFTGHEAKYVDMHRVKTPRTGLAIGKLDGVLYTTVRDGKTEKYIHKFKNRSRPLLAASSDGKSLHILGGEYEFTERGIVDDD